MEQLQNRGIKDIIDEYPEVGTILDSYEIGCVPCSLGTCKLKDVVDIHDLDPQVELDMMKRIAAVVFPGQEVDIPLKERKAGRDMGGVRYSPPMKILVEEHILIMRVVSLIPQMVQKADLQEAHHRQNILDTVDFIRSYADHHHHAKEEEILFGYFDGNIDIVQVMLEDHVNGRAHVQGTVEAVEARDAGKLAMHLTGYAMLLTQHIKKEDEILYPWMDRELSDRQVGQMFAQFNEIDSKSGDIQARYEALVSHLEGVYAG